MNFVDDKATERWPYSIIIDFIVIITQYCSL